MDITTKKLIYAGIVVVTLLTLAFIFRDELTLESGLKALGGITGYIASVWLWLDAKEEKEKRIIAEDQREELATAYQRENLENRVLKARLRGKD